MQSINNKHSKREQSNKQQYELYDEMKQNNQQQYTNTSNNSNYDQYNYSEQYYYYQQYEYEDEPEYEDEYEQWNDYDDCDYDPITNKMIKTTYTSDKKPKHKPDPLVQSKQNAMKIINKINNYNQYKSRHKYKGNNNLYYVIVINGKQLLLGSIRGNRTTILYSNKSGFQSGKHNKGGQSAQRFGRIYDNKINSFIKECATKINKLFENIINCNGIILCGNGSMKNKLYQCKELKQNIKTQIIKTVNTQNSGSDGLKEIFQKIKHNELFKQSELENKSDNIIIKEIMKMVEDENKCDMISIGIYETIKAIQLKIIKYVILTDGYYKYVIKKKSKPIKFIRNDKELNDIIEEMNITINKKNKTWKIVDYVGYVMNLCRINNVQINVIANNCENSEKFSQDLCGCVGVLYQSFEYLNE